MNEDFGGDFDGKVRSPHSHMPDRYLLLLFLFFSLPGSWGQLMQSKIEAHNTSLYVGLCLLL